MTGTAATSAVTPSRPPATPAAARTETPAPRPNRDRGIGSGTLYVILSVGLVVMAGPFVWMLLSSFKPNAEVRRTPPTWWPEQFTLDNYYQVFTRLHFPNALFNSVFVAVAVTFGTLVMCSIFGYALAKLDFPGRRALFLIVMGTLMVPGMVTFIPQFVLISQLDLVDTYAGLILPSFFGAHAGPFGVFLMRQFIMGLPDELIDAARVDGAGEVRIFFRVILPLCTPALATLGILTFLGSWNNFLWPLVVAQSEDMFTLPVALATYSDGQNATEYVLLLAGASIVVLPTLLVFMLLQRYFVQGIAMTGIK
jgi:multiple sugar transport system permease protein